MHGIIKLIKSFLLDKQNYSQFRKNNVVYGTGLKINGKIRVNGTSISLGKNVKINSGINHNFLGGSSTTLLQTRGGKIIIGNNVGISNSVIISADEIVIEDNVMIGGDCKIYDTDFHSVNYTDRVFNCDINALKEPVIIKEGTFIGAHSMILKGVIIGEKSVIAAGSVVTKSVPPGELWGGVPARFIKLIEDE